MLLLGVVTWLGWRYATGVDLQPRKPMSLEPALSVPCPGRKPWPSRPALSSRGLER